MRPHDPPAQALPQEEADELYEDAPCGYLSTVPGGEIVRVNRTLLGWTGYARDELLGRRFQDLLTAGGRIYHETHYAPLLRMQGAVREIALELICADGRRLPVLVNSVLRTDGDGRPTLVRTTIFDATHRRTYERELLLARERERAARQRMERLQRLSAALAAAVDTAQMTKAAVTALAEDLAADDVAVVLMDPQSAELEIAGHSAAAGGSADALDGEDRAALDEIIRSKRALLWSADPADDAPPPSLARDAAVQALAVLPLIARNRPIGALLLRFAEPREFAEAELSFMDACAAQCVQALERARLYDNQRTIARTLQDSMLAGEPPQDPRFAIAACYLPAVESLDVGGDWHDTFCVREDTIGLVIGDVVGRGIEAATAMGQLRSAARALAGAGSGPAELLEHLDRFVDQLPRARLATVAYAELDLRTGHLRYSSAGHPPMLLVAPAEPPRLLWDGRSTPLGTRLGPRAEAVGALDLQPGARLVLFTDGLIERRVDPIDEALEVLAREVDARRTVPIKTLLSEIVDTLVGADRDDDVCVMCLEFAPGAAGAVA